MKQRLGWIIALGVLAVLLGACTIAGPRAGADPVSRLTEQLSENGSSAIQEDAMSPNQEAHMQPIRIDKSQFKRAAEISSDTWINSEKLNWSELRGKVVVVDFWTFACYNCKNTLPYKKEWDKTYRAQGLVVLGVHTPELSFEKDVENVRKAVKEYNIQYPVAMDGDFANWNRYNVWAWPTWFIVDKEGYIRYTHVGEGDYAGSEKMIQQLLAE